MSQQDLFAWPGKSPTTPGGPEHPAICHMLDVAAVAERLIAPFSLAASLKAALVGLVALHDLGKISITFRAMLRNGQRQPWRHWQVSEAMLLHYDSLIARRLGGRPAVRQMLYAASAGHHGAPPNLTERDLQRALALAGEAAVADAGAAVAGILDLWPGASLEGLARPEARALSWWLPGLVAASDWIGSHVAWFPPTASVQDLDDYLQLARARAAVAVDQAGLSGVAVAPGPLFDFAMRPMQAACAGVALPDGPVLAVIEDETGAGKTEAALILAQRMLQAGKGRGLFLALPTMATADAMFGRAVDSVGRMFAAPPSVTLAHGRSALSTAFRALVDAHAASPDAVTCTSWLAENRRKALLADVGVGTVDQALLAALPTRFNTLRHFGLSSKILIVDEVHEIGEPYMGALLERLLQLHRGAGGSAILLTATLPLDLRGRLLATYGAVAKDRAYPALTLSDGTSRGDFPQAIGARGPVRVARLDSAAATVALLGAAAGQGAACVWVRNAVDDAIAAVQALRAAGLKAELLHARYALADRKRIEAAALARFGKGGNGADRAGHVLVATQVVESSLDLDFDVMVSDLAPMAALVQRAGRLWRHMAQRPQADRPVPGPVLHVLAPDPARVADARWLRDVLGSGAFVYPVDMQWRTAEHLFRTGQIVAPAGLRDLIEAVHGADLPPVPDVLAQAEMERLGEDAARANHAWQNAIRLDTDFRNGGQASDDADYPTRLGRLQRTLVLARRGPGGLIPWAEGPDGWSLSEVTAARSRLDALPLPDQTAPEIAAITADWPDWKRAEARLCPLEADGTICEGLRYDAELGLLFDTPPTRG